MTGEPILRPWQLSDAPALLRHRRAAADLSRELPEMADVAAARAAIESWKADRRFAIVHNGVAIGGVGITHMDRKNSIGWVSYWMSRQGRGKGWTKRAVCTIADHALFLSPNPLYRLELGHRLNNPASARVAEAAGFIQEGIERQKLSYDGQRFDTRSMARLRTDPVPSYEPLELQA
ncbi:GNAT family protein [Luteococcus sp. H138]|uniref:GNAT family N-acetyltransferase n=1 Tax=unclassified Luteococcus TaxID=2639923 RepID=UPI00313A8E36